MRVLHLLDHAARQPCDYSRRAHALLRNLRAQGVQTVHLTGPAPGASAQRGTGLPDGWHYYATPAPVRPLALLAARLPGTRFEAALSTLALAARLRRVARLTRPDLIHVHLPSAHAVAAWPVARLAGIPLLVDTERRGGPGFAFPRAERWALGAAQSLAAGSDQLRARLRAEGLGRRRIDLIPLAPDPLPAPPGARRMPDLLGAPLLAYAGGAGPDDGLGLLLAALARLRRRWPALRLLVGAAGMDQAWLQRRLADPALRGHVAFAGPLSHRRAADLLARADVAVFPALAGKAPLLPSRHLLNALAQGCAVVASDLACHRELLVHGRTGLLFEAGRQAPLAAALASLLEAPWRIEALGAAARDGIASRRSWEQTAARYRGVYTAMLDSA